MERFESVIDDVKDMGVLVYADPVENAHKLEIWVKSGDQEYLYRFIGPGVRNTNIPMFDDRLDLAKENEELKAKSKDISDDNALLLETNKKLKKELEERTVSAVAAKEKNKLLEIENEKLKKELSLEKDANKAQHKNTRADILEQAKECVCGQREQDYGTPESNFQLIADLWNGYLGFLDHPGWQQIRATDVSMMMALLKIARIRNGGGSGDSFVDLAGYAACGGEIWDGERH